MHGVAVEHVAEAEARGLGEALLAVRRRPDLAREADLADRRHRDRERLVAERARDRQGDGQVGSRLGDADAADCRDVDVESRERQVRSPLEHREQHRHAGGVHPVDDPSRLGSLRLHDERLHLHRQSPTPLDRDRHARAARGGAGPREEQSAGVGDLGDAVTGHLEAAHLIRRPEAVLVGAHETQRGLAVALELQHDIHEVFEQAGAGDRAVFGDVADEQHRQVAILADADERRRDLAHLRGPAGEPVGEAGGDGLHAVDDHQLRLHLVDLAEDCREVGLGGEEERGLQGVGAFGAQAHLAHRLLGADVEHALAGGGGATGDLEQQRRLADTGLAAEQDRCARHDPAAEHAVELGDAAGPVGDGLRPDLGDRAGAAGGANGGDARGGRRGIHDRVPLLALAAAADPLGCGPAALGAAELGGGASHAASLGRAGDSADEAPAASHKVRI